MNPEDKTSLFARKLTLIVTNLIKLCGLGLALNEVLIRGTPRTVELFVAVFMMTGAQVSEDVIIGLAANFFGVARRGKPHS